MTEGPMAQGMPKRRGKTFLVLIAIFVVVFSTVMIANIPNLQGMFEARAVFKAFNEALITRDYAMAYNLLAPETKANVSYEKFAGIQDKLRERVGTLRSFSTSKMDTKGDSDNLVTAIQASCRFESGKLHFEYVLKKEHGVWFIYSFNEL
jgi:hypothetical protein